jgi:hypothetical protein
MYSLFVGLWPILHTIYDTCVNILYVKEINDNNDNNGNNDNKVIIKKISRNFISATDCFGTICFGLGYYFTESDILLNCTVLYPISYYIYDIYYIINHNLIDDNMYIVHHILSIIFFELWFLYREYVDIYINFLLALELSNIPMFIVYHYLQLNKLYPNDKKIIKRLNDTKIIQLLLYGIIRIFYLLYCIYSYNTFIPGYIIPFVLLFYFMGVYWTGILCKGYYENIFPLIKDE